MRRFAAPARSLEWVSLSRECYCFWELWGNYNKSEWLLGFGDLLLGCYLFFFSFSAPLHVIYYCVAVQDSRCWRLKIIYVSNATLHDSTVIRRFCSQLCNSGRIKREWKKKSKFLHGIQTTKTVFSGWIVMSRSRTSIWWIFGVRNCRGTCWQQETTIFTSTVYGVTRLFRNLNPHKKRLSQNTGCLRRDVEWVTRIEINVVPWSGVRATYVFFNSCLRLFVQLLTLEQPLKWRERGQAI